MADNLKIRQPLDDKNNQCEGVAASAWLVTRGVGFRSRVGSYLHLADRARREQSFSSGSAEDFSDIESCAIGVIRQTELSLSSLHFPSNQQQSICAPLSCVILSKSLTPTIGN